MKIAGNEVLLIAFVEHYAKFEQEHKSDDGNGLNVSIMLLSVGLACNIWIVLQDTPFWLHGNPKHWIKNHTMNCIHRTKDDEMRKRNKIFMVCTINNKKNLARRG